jgi:hypothetical protein
VAFWVVLASSGAPVGACPWPILDLHTLSEMP